VRHFLGDADMLVTDVKSLFFNTGDFATAARLKDIQGRLADEIRALERLRCQHVGVSPVNPVAPRPVATSTRLKEKASQAGRLDSP
jgi:hypothetical protein